MKPINTVVAHDVVTFQNSPFAPDGTNKADWYQRLAVRSAIYPGKGTPFGLMYCALGLGEAGEVQNKVKKAFRDDEIIEFDGAQHGIPFRAITPERKRAIIKELGGNLWYIASLCAELGITMSEVMATNLEELASRSERGTLSGDGDNR